jgi:hypothetical protein
MASSSSRKPESQKHRPLHVSKSFSRLETSPGSTHRSSRANTIQNVIIHDRPSLEKENVPGDVKPPVRTNSTDQNIQEDNKRKNSEDANSRSPIEVDELPIELKSLTDR